MIIIRKPNNQCDPPGERAALVGRVFVGCSTTFFTSLSFSFQVSLP